MQKLIISLEIIAKTLYPLIKENPAILPDLLKDESFNTEEELLEHITHMHTECQNWDMLNGINQLATFNGKEWNLEYPTNQPVPCETLFKHISAFSDYVARSYDDENYPWEQSAWDEGYCSGDDDVDYNSSYLDACIAWIELYLLTQKLTNKECTTWNK